MASLLRVCLAQVNAAGREQALGEQRSPCSRWSVRASHRIGLQLGVRESAGLERGGVVFVLWFRWLIRAQLNDHATHTQHTPCFG